MKYRLMRQDDNGNQFLIEESERMSDLEIKRHNLERGGHKQVYWVLEVRVRPGIYEHFKGKLYEVICVARHKDDGTEIVVYRKLYDDFAVFWQKESEFTEWVNKGDYEGPRFKLIKEF